MTQEQLNQYIEHYLDKDKTQSAIMLTGAWGSGKSYYIKNTLKPYLKKKGKDCIVVSLYGIKDLSEISKAIYLELRSIKFLKSNEATETAKIIGKTVLKNAVQFVPMLNVDTKVSKRDLKKLYESVNLRGKLIVFEDIERSSVDIIEFLGYVNNFVEQDSVKALLVANEEEILKIGMPIESENEEERTSIAELLENRWRSDDDEQEVNQLSDTVKKYILIKEKTISDTVQYKNDYEKATTNILKSFKFEYFNEIVETGDVNRILGIVKTNKGNLRTFIFACQKAKDIIERIPEKDNSLFKHILISIIIFSYKYKRNSKINWEESTEKSAHLGSEFFPLFKPCYEYIVNHNLNEDELIKIKISYENFKKYNEEALSNEDVNILFQYHVQTEAQLLKSIDNIKRDLEKGEIPLTAYGRIAVQLIYLKGILENDIDSIKSLLVDNLKGKAEFIDRDIFSIYEQAFASTNLRNEYNELKGKMIDSLNYKKYDNWWGFDYSISKMKEFSLFVTKNRGEILREEYFIKNADIDKIIILIKACDAEQLQQFRGIFQTVYSVSNIAEFCLEDKEELKELQSGVLQIINDSEGMDKIIKLQLEWLVDNLEEIIKKLEQN